MLYSVLGTADKIMKDKVPASQWGTQKINNITLDRGKSYLKNRVSG